MLCLALVIQLLAPAMVEALRLRLLSTLLAPLRLVSGAADLSPAPAGAIALGRSVDARHEEMAVSGHPSARAFRVMDLDLARGRLVLAGGQQQGISLGARVSRGGICIGQVDRVEAQLSRVLLLSQRRSRLAVKGVPSATPAGAKSLPVYGVLIGEKSCGRLAEAVLGGRLKLGDPIYALGEDDGGPGLLVGRVIAVGLEPKLSLIGDPRGAAWLGADVRGGAPIPGTFRRQSCRLVSPRSGRFPGSVLRGAPRGLSLGSALVGGSWYLGLVASVGRGCIIGLGPEEPGGEISVSVVVHGESWAASLGACSLGGCEVTSWHGGVPADGEATVFTAGGQSLIPPSLLVGTGVVSSGRLRLRRPKHWPRQSEVVVFRYPEQRARLIGRRR